MHLKNASESLENFEKIVEKEREREKNPNPNSDTGHLSLESSDTLHLDTGAASSTLSFRGDKMNPTSRNPICPIVRSSPKGTAGGARLDPKGQIPQSPLAQRLLSGWTRCNQSPNSHAAYGLDEAVGGQPA